MEKKAETEIVVEIEEEMIEDIKENQDLNPMIYALIVEILDIGK